MKVTSTTESTFQPYTVSVTVETPEEHDFMKFFFGAEITIPQAYNGCRNPVDGRDHVKEARQLLRLVYAQLVEQGE